MYLRNRFQQDFLEIFLADHKLLGEGCNYIYFFALFFFYCFYYTIISGLILSIFFKSEGFLNKEFYVKKNRKQPESFGIRRVY
jgi:hypothetical protein